MPQKVIIDTKSLVNREILKLYVRGIIICYNWNISKKSGVRWLSLGKKQVKKYPFNI